MLAPADDAAYEIRYQHRLITMFHAFVAETGVRFVPENFQTNGDGFHYFLPATSWPWSPTPCTRT